MLVNRSGTPGGTLFCATPATLCPMAKQKLGRHYIKEWRKAKGLSLRKLADRLEVSPGGEPLLSYVSLGRIERGEQPFNEETIDAIADALGVTRLMLLEVHPEREGTLIELFKRLPEKDQEHARKYLETLAKTA